MLTSLNTEQRAAVERIDGPTLIVAGPGTGKTKTLTSRIAHLVQTVHVPAEEILALTFTNKAAKEMQERVSALLDKGDKRPAIATFHSLAHLLLTLPETATLVSNIERMTILAAIKKALSVKLMSVQEISLAISNAKNQPSKLPSTTTQLLLDAYHDELRSRNLYDYDDLLLWLHEALRQPEFHARAARFSHILVDEFQDTNELQYEIIKLLNRTDNLFFIGDPLQSIYGFRGASADIFDRFEHDFPKTRRIQLVTNYRSAPQIVALTNKLFPDAPPLRAHRVQRGVVQAVEVLNEQGEADGIIDHIERQVGGSDMVKSSKHHTEDSRRTFGDFAIMYRTHAMGRTVQAALEKSGIPYQVAGEGSPFLQPHAAAVMQSLAYLTDLGDAPAVGGLSSSQTAVLLAPLKIETNLPIAQLTHKIIAALHLSNEQNATDIRQFTNAMIRHEDMSPKAYVQHVQQLAEQQYYDPAAGAVTLLTIHASKGLEFPVVFLLAAEDGSLPLVRKGIVADIEEEKRLFYVAVTRARDELYALHTRKRRGQERRLTPFLEDVPQSIMQHISDPNMTQQLRRIQRSAQKRAQGSLF